MKTFHLSFALALTLTLLTQCAPNTGDKEATPPKEHDQFEYTYKDGILQGPYKAYYDDGKLWAEGNYDKGNLNGAFKSYTHEGELASEEVWENGTLFQQKIYWQSLPGDDKNFLFVSKEGFMTMENGVYLKLDSLTPNNIIEESIDMTTHMPVNYIWKDGKRVPIKS